MAGNYFLPVLHNQAATHVLAPPGTLEVTRADVRPHPRRLFHKARGRALRQLLGHWRQLDVRKVLPEVRDCAAPRELMCGR